MVGKVDVQEITPTMDCVQVDVRPIEFNGAPGVKSLDALLWEESRRIYKQDLAGMSVGKLMEFSVKKKTLYAFQASEEAKDVILGKDGLVNKKLERQLRVTIVASREDHIVRMKGKKTLILQGYDYIQNTAQDSLDFNYVAEILSLKQNETAEIVSLEEEEQLDQLQLDNAPDGSPPKKRFWALFATVLAIAVALFLIGAFIVHYHNGITECQIQAQEETIRYVEYQRQVAELNTWLENRPTTFYQVKLAEVPLPISCLPSLWH